MTAEATTLGAAFAGLRRRFEAAGIGDAALDARLLLEAVTGMDHALLISRPETPVAIDERQRLEELAVRRIGGEPVFRILGWREFHGLRLGLSPAVLEPRPDTETLVELALEPVRAAAARHGHARILDLGTGSGAIALALLSREPRASAVGADISAEALATAGENARRHAFSNRFRTLQSDWFGSVTEKFHAILSNPPYIRRQDIAALAPEVRLHDPFPALDGGPDGLDAYRAIAAGARDVLHEDGHVLVEIGQGQADEVTAIFDLAGFRCHRRACDLSGTIRALWLRPEGLEA